MKKLSVLAALLLMVVGLQTAWGQGFRVYKSDGTFAQYSLRTDSIVFYDNLGTDVDFGPFTPVNQCIAGTWYKSHSETVTFNEDGTTDYVDGATYEFMPYQGTIVINNASGMPVSILKVHKLTSEMLVMSTLGDNEFSVWYSTIGESPSELTYTVNGVSFKMIPVEGGTFQMGNNDAYDREKPVHQVTLSSFSIGETEVTQELWQAVMGSNPSYFKGSKLPVEWVSWNDCQTFVTKLNQLTGKTFRLPTEAEWEYAARGGTKSNGYTYSGSNTIGDVAWYTVNSYDLGSSSPDYGTHEVATKVPNELGIYDMSGNVEEWCQDWFGDYSSGSQTNPTGPSSGSGRVLRGGSWYDYAGGCRVSNRNLITPTSTGYDLGFRLAL